MSHPLGRRSAFTLIELLVVIAIAVNSFEGDTTRCPCISASRATLRVHEHLYSWLCRSFGLD